MIWLPELALSWVLRVTSAAWLAFEATSSMAL